MYLIAPIITALFFAILDGSPSSLAVNVFILLLGLMFAHRVNHTRRIDFIKLLTIIYPVYISIAYIYSTEFGLDRFFFVSDPVKYLELYLSNRDYIMDMDRLLLYFTDADGKDVLYHQMLQLYSGIGNTVLGGATVYYMTLLQTMFGLLSSFTLYIILVKRFGNEALRYTLVFSICSLFLLYSNVILRDIVIAYFFIESINIVLGKFKISNLFILILLAVLTAGIRMQSGLFGLSFAVVYVYLAVRSTKYKYLIYPMFFVIALIAITYIGSSIYYDNAADAIERRENRVNEEAIQNNGLFSYFSYLPIGVKQIALYFYSQICPFPPYFHMFNANNITQFLIGFNVVIMALYWYIISYTFTVSFFFKKTYRIFSANELFLLFLSVVYIIALTAQPDIRRMMPVYPLIYILYIKSNKSLSKVWVRMVKKRLIFTYVALLMTYFVLSGFK